MYAWLTDALQGPSSVVTANRRLARVLSDEYARRQLRAGELAWQSPKIYSWQDWLGTLFLGATGQASLPTRINQHQSQVLWERCLSKEIGESMAGLTGLARLSRESWQRLADWRVTIGEVARSAQTHDQRLFAVAAGRYLGILEREHWVDDAGLAAVVGDLISTGRAAVDGRITFAGFDRDRPSVSSISAGLVDSGCDVRSSPEPGIADSIGLQRFETADAELRAAGAWARERLLANPEWTLAIIAGNLQQDATRITRLVREGLVPGWQYAPPGVGHYVNVSYGRKLIDFPAVSIALLLVRWLVQDLSAVEIGHLLRSPLLGQSEMGGRSRLELRLRQLPDRHWSPSMFSAAMRGRNQSSDVSEWLGVIATITKLRREIRKNASPAEWAIYIDSALKAVHWPGKDGLDSFDFQLVNRWRELLNDLARLDLVSPAMSLKTALRRLELMAADTVFQPESEHKGVQLIGPLEAAGAQFDAIWISGLAAANWPPAGNPSPLVSRRLQQQKGMPDAEPADTVAYAQGLLLRLGSAASEVVCSYPQTLDDAEQTPSDLLQALRATPQEAQSDPGWHASRLSKMGRSVVVADTVPMILPDERVSGGATIIQRQLTDPITAFIVGRLGVKNLQPQAIGLPAPLRGNLIHDALCQLYIDRPSRDSIAAWSDDELSSRIEHAVNTAFARHERNVDSVLIELLTLERRRIVPLLRRLVTVDRAREDFAIEYVEHEVEFAEASVRLQLRVDRIDRLTDGSLAILDYKTGAKKKFLQSDGQPNEIQLIAYAHALEDPVSAVALVNIDTREVVFDGAGHGYTDETLWQDSLTQWTERIGHACQELSSGDIRINGMQGVKDARYFNLLSRFTELRRGS